MSSGPFQRSRYETDAGDVARIRVQPETLALSINAQTNAPPAGAIDIPGSANVNAGRRSNGINARLVRVTWTGAAPAGYKADGVISLPWLVADTFAALIPGQTGTYLGQPVELVGKTGESIR